MMRRDGEGARVLGLIRSVETAVCGVGLILTTLLIFAQVLNRYMFHFEIMFLNDLALYTFIGFMLVAAAYTTWKEGHVAVDVFRQRLVGDRPLAAAAYRVLLVALAISTLSRLLPVAYGFMRRAIQYPQYGTLVRWFNESWLQILVFWSLLLVLLHLLVIAGRDLQDLAHCIRKRSRQGGR